MYTVTLHGFTGRTTWTFETRDKAAEYTALLLEKFPDALFTVCDKTRIVRRHC